MTPASRPRTHIAVNGKTRITLVAVSDIIFLKADSKLITLVTRDANYQVSGTLKQFRGELGDTFIRLHRNTLAAKEAIRELSREDDRWYAVFSDTEETRQISRREIPVVRKWLKQGRM